MLQLIKETFTKWYEDNPAQRGAAMAFYAIFAIAPLLVIAVALAGSVFGLGFFLLLSLVATMASTTVSQSVAARIPGSAAFWQWVDFLVSFVLLTSLVAVIYKVVPAVRIAWRNAWVGAAVTSLLFTLGKWLIGWYLVHSTVTSAYGAAGSLIVILLWVYYYHSVK